MVIVIVVVVVLTQEVMSFLSAAGFPNHWNQVVVELPVFHLTMIPRI